MEKQKIHPYRNFGDHILNDKYTFQVKHSSLPKMSILKKNFSPNGVCKIFNGSYVWGRDSTRNDKNDVKSKDVVSVLKHFNYSISSYEAIQWGLRYSLLPADLNELYAFAMNEETSQLQFQFPIVGLGSYTMYFGIYVPVLTSISAQRALQGSRSHSGIHGWGIHHRFLYISL